MYLVVFYGSGRCDSIECNSLAEVKAKTATLPYWAVRCQFALKRPNDCYALAA